MGFWCQFFWALQMNQAGNDHFRHFSPKIRILSLESVALWMPAFYIFLVPTIWKQQVWTPRTLREIATSRFSSIFYVCGSLVWSFFEWCFAILFQWCSTWPVPLDCLLTIVYLPNTWSQYARDRLTLIQCVCATHCYALLRWPQGGDRWPLPGSWCRPKWGQEPHGTRQVWHLEARSHCMILDQRPDTKGDLGSVWYVPFVKKRGSYFWHSPSAPMISNPKVTSIVAETQERYRKVYQGVVALYLRFTWKNWHHYWFRTHHTRSQTSFYYIAALSHSMW